MDMEKREGMTPQPQPAPSFPVTPPPVMRPVAPVWTPKPLFPLTGGDTAFALLAVAACVFTVLAGVFGGFALGYALSVPVMILLLCCYFAKGSQGWLPALPYGLLALAIGSVFVCTSNGAVRFFAVVIGFLLALVCYDTLRHGSVRGNRPTLGIFFAAGSSLEHIDVAAKSLFSNRDGEKKTLGKVLVGLLCALPVLLVVVPLLISSDEAFKGLMTQLFSRSFVTILKSLLGVALAVLVITYGFSLKHERVSRLKDSTFAGIENAYIISFLSAIGVCYLLYLFSQLAYFFSAFRGFLPDKEITYAQYARKGFFEMCVIAVINLVLVFLALALAKKKAGKVCHGIKALTTFIALFSLVIIATALSKMVLYISAYGMTVLRLGTSAFMVLLTVVFLGVILRIYIRKINVVKTALLTAGCVVLVLGVGNVDAVCARYNYTCYQTKRLEKIDVQALYQLGDEGIPYLIKLTGDDAAEVASQAQYYLARVYLQDYFEDMPQDESFTIKDLQKQQKNKGIMHFSIPRQIAYRELYRAIQENPHFGLMAPQLVEHGWIGYEEDLL